MRSPDERRRIGKEFSDRRIARSRPPQRRGGSPNSPHFSGGGGGGGRRRLRCRILSARGGPSPCTNDGGGASGQLDWRQDRSEFARREEPGRGVLSAAPGPFRS